VKQILAVKYQVFSQLCFYCFISQINFSEFSIGARVRARQYLLKRMGNSLLSLGLKRFALRLFCTRLLTMSLRRAAIWNTATGEKTTTQAGKVICKLTANSLRSDFKGHIFQPETLELILMNDVVAAFNEYFEILDADSPELLCEVFHLRYQVLCIEQRAPGFEASSYPEKMESDGYDRHSSHILLRHRPSEKFVGTARLILPDPLDPCKLFPTERHMRLDPALIDVNKLPRQSMGEISRLVVVRRFSRRRDELLHALENGAQVEKWVPTMQRRFPHPMLALAIGIIRMSVENNVNHWLSVMEPALNRLLGLYGLQLDPVGPIIDHHGLRRPYYVDLVQMLDRMYKNHNQFWELVTDYGKVRPAAEERGPEAVQAPKPRSWNKTRRAS
jgi:N-acyl amino acid synthase of PEP-CTERM/exosortase system